MFTKAKNIDTAFQHIRTFSVVFLIGSVTLCGFVLYRSFKMVSESSARIYILANGKALEAYGADRKDNIPVEARDHVKVFHQDFFTLDPDEKVITANITRALYMADRSAKKQYDNLKESGYFTNLITANISQEIELDSIEVNINSYPFYFRCVAHERLIRSTTIVTRNLITEGYLRNVARSDNNPHGFLIEKWMILENKDIKTDNR